MNRLALPLAVAAAVLGGTGCGSTCTNGTALVTWGGFDGPGAGAVDVDCVTAGVASVDLWLDNQLVGNWPCTDYSAAVPGVPTGGNVLDVEGIAPDGRTILFRDSLSFTQGCNSVALPAHPGAGTVDLQYTFESGPTCTASTSYMWFSLFDVIANAPDPATIDVSSSLATQESFACGSPAVVTLPAGQYDLDSMTEMTETVLHSGVWQQTASGCKLPAGFTVASGTQTPVPVSLADTGVACLP